jgi:hypothetical protein
MAPTEVQQPELRAQPEQIPRTAPKEPEKQVDASLSTVLYWRNLTVGFLMFTCIIVVILLQLLM